MKYFLLLFFIILALNSGCSQSPFTEDKTETSICFSDDGKIFPESWYSAEIKAKSSSLDSSEYSRSKKIVASAMSKYPPCVIKNNLKAVYVLKDIEFFGVPFGGTNSNDVVYLANDGIKNGYTDFYLEQSFHEEFSSILLRNHKNYFDETQWIRSNDNVLYGDGGVEAIRAGKDDNTINDSLNKRGILDQYAMSDIENDFNSFASNIFMPDKDFWPAVAKYPRIRKKLNLAVEFYSQIDKSFTKEFFIRQLDTSKNKPD